MFLEDLERSMYISTETSRLDCNDKYIELIEGRYLEVVVEAYLQQQNTTVQ